MHILAALLANLMLVVLVWEPSQALAQSIVALTGQVTSAEEGAMEGVVVSAKRDGSTITVSVVTDAQGRYAFPAARLEPGKYTLRLRAAGYQLEWCADRRGRRRDRKPRPTSSSSKLRSLSAHLTNAEWLHSMPGTDPQKKFLLNCIGCHTPRAHHEVVLRHRRLP